jgi:hypothetical protein
LNVPVTNIDVDQLIQFDPSEAMDSDRILPCLARWFPDAQVRLLGGAIYHCGLSDVIHNLMADGATQEIARALELDDMLLQQGHTHYASAIAVK